MSTNRVDDLVRSFARLLAGAWPEVVAASRMTEADNFVQDWLQANWEAVVEAGVGPGVFLEIYGEGADCNDRSSRVFRPEAAATHAVVCLPRPGEASITDRLTGRVVAVGIEGVPLEELVSLEGSWFVAAPPFDCVLVEGDDLSYVFKMSDVVFALGAASRG